MEQRIAIRARSESVKSRRCNSCVSDRAMRSANETCRVRSRVREFGSVRSRRFTLPHRPAPPTLAFVNPRPRSANFALMVTSALRALPSVEKLLSEAPLAAALQDLPRTVVVGAVRVTLAEARDSLKRAKNGAAPAAEVLARRAAERARADATPALRRVLNATGIVLH